MSDDTQNQLNQNPGDEDTNEKDVVLQEDELTSLKKRADLMGLKYHPSISTEKLKEKITAALTAPVPAAKEEVTDVATIDKQVTLSKGEAPKADAPELPANIKAEEDEDTGEMVFSLNETPTQKRARLRRDANEQVRIRVTCMNPNKKDWHGEIFTVGNSAVGTLKKFVPFNAEEGWHVPRLILQAMQERQCQVFVNGKAKNGIKVRESKLIKEFAIEILDPLTQTELNELARRQAMANGSD